MTTRRARSRGTGRNLDTTIKIIGILLALGAPIVSLISMMSAYKEKQVSLSIQVDKLSEQLFKISDDHENGMENTQTFKQNILDNSSAILRLQHSQDDQNEKILELWKQTSTNNARIDAQQTEIILLRNNQSRR